MNEKKKEIRSSLKHFQVSVLLLLLAFSSAVAATVAWFSISDNTKVNSMNMLLTSGLSMRFDLDPHAEFEEYVKSLSFRQISDRMLRERGIDMAATPLVPVTTGDCVQFTHENGEVVSDTSGEYLTFDLNFIAQKDMVVHLTTLNGDQGQGGTLISSANPRLAGAMRIGFSTDGKTYIYDPDMGNVSSTNGNVKTYGLPSGTMEYNDHNAMFMLKENQNKLVRVHVWLEGNDALCTNDLKGADYSVSLRFEGTTEDNKTFDQDSRGDEEEKAKGQKADDYVHNEREEDMTEESDLLKEEEPSGELHKLQKFLDELTNLLNEKSERNQNQ